MSGKNEGGDGESADAWVFDSLVNFLRGPVWNVPILTFIEHKSIIFEPDVLENEDEYKKIHEEYKNLVDFMLGSYMEDLGISPGQFETACGKASTRIKTEFHQALFEQVWAADDYEIFKRMMIQKNIELQLQALELLQQRYGSLPTSLQRGPDKKEKSGGKGKAAAAGGKASRQSESEDKIMEAVLQKSLAEHEEAVKTLDKEKKELEAALAASADEERARLEQQRDNQQALLAEHFKTKVAIQDPSVAHHPTKGKVSPSQSSSARPSHQSQKQAKNKAVLGTPSSTDHPTPSAAIDEEELKRRTEFLKAQRDKLLAMKKEEREKQLVEAEKAQVKSRPKSAHAARSAFGKGRAGSTAAASRIDPDTLKVRRALAEKLKQEVVGRH